MFEGLSPSTGSRSLKASGGRNERIAALAISMAAAVTASSTAIFDSPLINASRDLDVHMDRKGLNFACTQCHLSKQHIITGSRYDVRAKDPEGAGKPGLRRDVATCESCHGNAPHPMTYFVGIKLNGHNNKVACQTCHIPALARGGVATITDWDWRESGKTRDGVGYSEETYVQGNGEHRHTYRSIKGAFTYGETWPAKGRTLLPYYAWFDGQMRYTTIDTKFDPAKQPVPINAFSGSYDDPNARIWPFKRMHTIQPFDKGNNTLVYMHLWGEDKNAYWGNYDFGKAIEAAMKENEKPYSGQYGFVETYSYWPTTHMVAPKEKALDCGECHAKNGRLQNLAGFYMPGRDSLKWLDILGYLLIGGAFFGAIVHAIMRGLSRRYIRGHDHD